MKLALNTQIADGVEEDIKEQKEEGKEEEVNVGDIKVLGEGECGTWCGDRRENIVVLGGERIASVAIR